MLPSLRILSLLAVCSLALFLIGLTVAPHETTSPSIDSASLVKVEKEAEPLEPPQQPDAPNEEVKSSESPVETVERVAKTLSAPVPLPLSPISLNERVRESVVNILCIPQSGGVVDAITGSGVFIDPHGVILTNAHVAQYLLLENYPVQEFLSCTVRTGSPARAAYTAEILFIPPPWIYDNAEKIDDDAPMGNGEHDYALLYVTKSSNKEKEPPDEFPYLPLLYTEVSGGEDVLIAGYPAGFLGGAAITKDLYAVSSLTNIGELYTYGTSTVDLFSVGGSIVAQQGSSGGAVVDSTGNLVGLIVTSTDAADTASRDLHAVSSSYIARDFEEEHGVSLPTFLSRNLKNEMEDFKITTIPHLIDSLAAVLSR